MRKETNKILARNWERKKEKSNCITIIKKKKTYSTLATKIIKACLDLSLKLKQHN